MFTSKDSAHACVGYDLVYIFDARSLGILRRRHPTRADAARIRHMAGARNTGRCVGGRSLWNSTWVSVVPSIEEVIHRRKLLNASLTSDDATAKFRPCIPLNCQVFTPATVPFRVISGPPLFPGFSAASI
jgi:hypothetical protein